MFKYTWEVVQREPASAENNMKRDYRELGALSSTSNPQIHFYEWGRPSVTYGYFIRPEDFLNLNGVEELGWDAARRPTGGGVILHAYDLAFAALIPAGHPAYSINTLENYAWVNRRIAQALKALIGSTPDFYRPECSCTAPPTFCMAQPTQYDLMIEGRKVAGAAQRRTKQGFLHQGSICLTLPPKEVLDRVLAPGGRTAQDMLMNSYPLADRLDMDIEAIRSQLKSLLAEAFASCA
jgi:lipoate-protein ligase A